jgi:hypothetical protein
MRDNAAAARALRADEYESRFLRSVDSPALDVPRRREPSARAYGTRQGGSSTMVSSASGVAGRRTVQITGQATAPRRRQPAASSFVARPDRTAMWAFMLALFLVLMAVATAHAAV